ncbi:hypothetical protein IFM89_035105 [Coptis chinensis]|uniref:SET domain-containing protein n=1 Tax=Coptis chinensis TaxID=261450 RepID=A0A835IIK0_9MAGN|nr:hypothetical protein IFM89_035105 [Coptis chinensis]
MEKTEEAKVETLRQWLQINKVELRGCKIKHCGPNKGFGLFYNNDVNQSNGVMLVVPLDLAITPMSVLEDATLGPKCRAMFQQGDVDDRFLIILFLTVERLRKNSAWKPYLDMLPTAFGNPLWFTDEEFLELKGTTLYRATELQKKNLQTLYEDKVKNLVLELLDGESESEVQFKDFLWANSIFWTRALNIPFPHSYVFPQAVEEKEGCPSFGKDSDASRMCGEVSSSLKDEKVKIDKTYLMGGASVGNRTDVASNSMHGESIWVEGLVPGIDFCNHAVPSFAIGSVCTEFAVRSNIILLNFVSGLKAATTWEVDGSGSTTGVPASMYLLSAEKSPFQIDKEVYISYGNKGNEVHYPIEAFQSLPFADTKGRLLEIQKAEMRCLLPKRLLNHGFFSGVPQQCEDRNTLSDDRICNYSWAGQRKMPSYSSKLVFPEDFVIALRTIAMKEEELHQASSLLEELFFLFFKLVGSDEERQPSDTEVRAAIWEACGDSGALQLLVNLLQMKYCDFIGVLSGTEVLNPDLEVAGKPPGELETGAYMSLLFEVARLWMMELEEGSGTEACDTDLLEKAHVMDISEGYVRNSCCDNLMEGLANTMSRNKWSSRVECEAREMGSNSKTDRSLSPNHPPFYVDSGSEGGLGTGTGTKSGTFEEISVSFDLQTLYIPPLNSATTRFLGLPLPPLLKIDIVPELFQGTIDEDTGKVDLQFKAEFWFSVGYIYKAPPLLVKTILTSEESIGTMRIGRGQRLDREGKCRLVGVATVDPIDDFFMNTFLGLPTECLAVLNATIFLSIS